MKRFAILLAAVAVVAVPFTAQAASKSSSSSTKSSSDKTVLAVAKADPQMSMWVDLVKKAGLDRTFSSSSKKVTVFVPDNDAFKKLSKTDLDKLTKNTKDLAGVLLYHTITGDVPASKLEKTTSAKTLEGSDVKLATKDGTLHVNQAKVVKADIAASNGKIDEIDDVLAPSK